MLLISITVLIVGYLIGCLHGSNVIKLLTGVSLKNVGHGNAGASNATLTLGWKYGVLVAFIDIGKAILAILLLRTILDNSTITLEHSSLLLYLIGAGVIIGHNFPIHMKFKGGKGTASLIGAFIAIDWKIGCIALLTLIIVSLLTNYLIIGILVFYVFFGVTAYLIEPTIWPFTIILGLFLIAFSLHLENVNRLRVGAEPKVTSAFKKSKS